MRDEEMIASGILQAMRKGEPIRKVMQTFINAGYSRDVVESAAKLAEEWYKRSPKRQTEQARQETVQQQAIQRMTYSQPQQKQPETRQKQMPSFQPLKPVRPLPLQPEAKKMWGQVIPRKPFQKQMPMQQRMQMPARMPTQIHEFKTNEQLLKEFGKEETKGKPRNIAMEWIIAVLILLVTFIFNGWLIWRYLR